MVERHRPNKAEFQPDPVKFKRVELLDIFINLPLRERNRVYKAANILKNKINRINQAAKGARLEEDDRFTFEDALEALGSINEIRLILDDQTDKK